MLQSRTPPRPPTPPHILSVAGCTRSFHAAHPLTACTVGVTEAHGQASAMRLFTEWANASPPHICPSPPQPPSRGMPPPTTRQGCIRPSTVGLFNYCCEAVAVRMPPFQCHRLQDLPQPWQAPSPPAFRSPPAMRICCCKLPAHDHGPVVGLVVFSIAHGYIPAEGL